MKRCVFCMAVARHYSYYCPVVMTMNGLLEWSTEEYVVNDWRTVRRSVAGSEWNAPADAAGRYDRGDLIPNDIGHHKALCPQIREPSYASEWRESRWRSTGCGRNETVPEECWQSRLDLLYCSVGLSVLSTLAPLCAICVCYLLFLKSCFNNKAAVRGYIGRVCRCIKAGEGKRGSLLALRPSAFCAFGVHWLSTSVLSSPPSTTACEFISLFVLFRFYYKLLKKRMLNTIQVRQQLTVPRGVIQVGYV